MNFNQKTMNIRRGENFRILGRKYFENDVPVFTWSNSGIEFCAKFDRLTLLFGEYNGTQPAYVKIIIDGKESKHCIMGKGCAAIAENVRNTVHNVVILRISEAGEPLVIELAEIYGKDCAFLPLGKSDKKRRLRLEFIGDSITAGFGNIAPQSQNVYYTYQQDSTKTYAYLTALSLDAEIRTECVSGQGIVHSCGEETGIRFSEFFARTARHRADVYTPDEFVPDVFVINGGTNDKRSHVTSEEFEKAAFELMCSVRKMYPETPIIWLYGMMMHVFDEELDRAVGAFDKEYGKVSLLNVETIYKCKNETGAVGHPNLNASKRVAKLLEKEIFGILSSK